MMPAKYRSIYGPPPGSACGQVTVSPWKNGGSAVDGGLFTSKNCNNSPTPNDPPHQGQTAAQGAETFIEAIESPTPQLSALQFSSQLLGAINTLVAVGSAYNSCAP